MTAPLNSIAIIADDVVTIQYLSDAGRREILTLSAEEYAKVRELCVDGVLVNDFVIRPSAITRYLSGSSAASLDTAIDIEKAMMRRSMNKGMMDIMPYAVFVFLVLVGLGALYMMVSKDAGTATNQASNAASSMLAIK